MPHSAGDAGKTGAADPFAGLLDKLAQAVIIGAKVSCDYAVPAAPRGESFDCNKVNVLYSSSGTAPSTFPRVSDETPCMTAKGWKYDDTKMPTKVVLCPAACTKLQADANARIDVKFGCDTVILRPS